MLTLPDSGQHLASGCPLTWLTWVVSARRPARDRRPAAMTTLLPAFALASTLLILAPGPDSLLVLRNTLRHGRRAGWVTASGTLSGLLAWAAAAAFGLSALLRVSHLGYDALRLAGAGYLIWLGVSSLGPFRHAHPRPGAAARPAAPADHQAGRAGWERVYLN